MNLTWVSGLLVDPDKFSAKILSRMLEQFGLSKLKTLETAEEAKTALEQEVFDIVFCEGSLTGLFSAELLLWLRRLEGNPLRLIPVVVMSGYTQRSMVETSRDSGASLVLKKPVSAKVLHQHLRWVASGTRLFVESGSYSGPDRRFKNTGLPGGVGRRSTDLGGELGTQNEPNMSQDEIDSMIKPMKLEL